MPFEVDSPDGILILARPIAPLSVDDFSVFAFEVRRLVNEARRPAAICTDWRQAGVLTPDVYDAFVWMMRRDNPSIGGTAVLVKTGEEEQAARMLDEGQSSRRKLCTNVDEVLEHLGPLLDPSMRDAIRAFVSD